jgi:hypothetical protein
VSQTEEKLRKSLSEVRHKLTGCWCLPHERGRDEDYKEIHTIACIRAKQLLGEWTESNRRWHAVFFEEVADGRDLESLYPLSDSSVPLKRRRGSLQKVRDWKRAMLAQLRVGRTR